MTEPAMPPAGARIRELLAEIAAQPAPRWRALVDASFPDDAALRMQALMWLRADRARVADDGAPPALDDSDRYVLRVRLDAGASAAVWQAYDRKLGRDVAIKLFHAEHAEVVAAALAEARAACDVVGDHVVRVLDVHDGERPYIVMELIGEHDPQRGEYVPGGSAAHLRPRDLDEAVRWVRDVARGVHDAHLRNIFHRDVKPHNVLVAPISRRARIADFGLAIGAVSVDRGRIAGTPEYMAPECVHAPRTLDPDDAVDRARLVAIDVWGLGALAYDLIGGHPPWRGDAEREPWELAASGVAPPPLDRSVAPPRLARVIAKAMAIDPDARYASAAELANELDAILARRPTSHDRSIVLRAALWCRRNPQLSLTAAAATVLAALTLVAYLSMVELRGRSHELAREVEVQEKSNALLEQRMAKARAELTATEAEVGKQANALAGLQRALVEEQRTYDGIIAARDKALHEADAATRRLVEQLAIARSDRDAAALGREMYEGFWTNARRDADRAAKDRDQAQKERDAARGERDQLQKERDAARAERERLQSERDRAAAEVTRLEAAAHASAAKIAELERKLATANEPHEPGAGSAVGSGSAVAPHAP